MTPAMVAEIKKLAGAAPIVAENSMLKYALTFARNLKKTAPKSKVKLDVTADGEPVVTKDGAPVSVPPQKEAPEAPAAGTPASAEYLLSFVSKGLKDATKKGVAPEVAKEALKDALDAATSLVGRIKAAQLALDKKPANVK